MISRNGIEQTLQVELLPGEEAKVKACSDIIRKAYCDVMDV